MKIQLSDNWKKAHLSLAVWLPILSYTVNAFGEAVLKANMIPTPYVPLVMIVAGAVGKVIKQKSQSGAV